MERPRVDSIREIAKSLDPEFGSAVSRWEIELGEDWRGQPAVFVTIVLRDSEAHRVWQRRNAFRDKLRTRLFELLPEEYYPFISYSAESPALDPEIART